MKSIKSFLSVCALVLLVGGAVATLSSCDKTPTPEPVTSGTIKGVVTDEASAPIAGVTVTVSTVTATATTGADGSYTVADVPTDKSSTVTFTKDGYASVSSTVSASQFNEAMEATVNAVMEFSGAKIQGTVTDVSNNGAAIEGVTVSMNGTEVTTAADGKFLFENLTIAAYELSFAKGGFSTITRSVAAADFVDGVATLNVEMGAKELLRGKTAFDLVNADKWLYNEYRGGRNADDYPHWDWACDYMCSLTFEGWWEEQNEGTTLQIRNNEEEHWGNEADLEMFDSYTYGSKMITEDNKIMTLLLRTHAASEEMPAVYGVQVIDLSAADPEAVLIGEVKTLNSEDYVPVDFDLSAYVGKEVIIAIGIFRAETGDYWKQLVIRRIAFGPARVEGFDWIGGTAINETMGDWKLTQEMVRSTMVQTATSITGLSPVEGNRDNYAEAYRAWREVDHIGYAWSFVPRYKDPEVFPSEGYLIKTRGGIGANLETPEAYLYAKYAIAAGSDQLTLKARTFHGSVPTFFKITVITENCEVENIIPTAEVGEAGGEGSWKFCHEDGGWDNPDGYASFVYDLSAYDGQNVVIVLGVFKGEENGDENKLAIYSVDLE